jgi:protein-S-isoprenylcysteine O-methyltransferase Ste14
LQFFRYFQVFGLLFFLLVFVGRTLYLRFRRGINAITLGIGKKGVKQVVEILFFVGLIVWIIEVLLYALSAEFHLFQGILSIVLVDSIVAKWMGVVINIISFSLFVWALASFGDSWRVGIDSEKPGNLVESGAFGISRNPIFVFLDLYFIGTFLLNGTVVFLLFAVVIVVGLHYQILQEERFLKGQYGEAYERYCVKTSRYLSLRRWGKRNLTPHRS